MNVGLVIWMFLLFLINKEEFLKLYWPSLVVAWLLGPWEPFVYIYAAIGFAIWLINCVF